MPDCGLAAHDSEKKVVSNVFESSIPGWPGTYIPNFSQWLAGDIVLVGAAPNLIGHVLRAGQAFTTRTSLLDDANYWTHAALYVGKGQLVEAVFPDGVIESSIWRYCENRSVLVRRLDAPFTLNDGVVAAQKAKTLVGNPYSWQEVMRSVLIPGTEPDPQRFYCSTFVGFTINASTGFSLYGAREHLPLHPSTLARHPDLMDVHVEWRHPMPMI